MKTNRLEAFSDGVLAIIITIMVLEMKVPEGRGIDVLIPLLPIFLSYLLSFVYIGIYWNNHHHLLHTTNRVNGNILWANMHLLFWLSLVPFTTGWMGNNLFEPIPCALYGFVMLMAGFAYWLLQKTIINSMGNDSVLAKAIGKDLKGKISLVSYTASVLLSFLHVSFAVAIYVGVALLWLVPDKRIESQFSASKLNN